MSAAFFLVLHILEPAFFRFIAEEHVLEYHALRL